MRRRPLQLASTAMPNDSSVPTSNAPPPWPPEPPLLAAFTVNIAELLTDPFAPMHVRV